MLRIITAAFSAALLIMGTGCTFNHKLEVEPHMDSLPATTKSPMNAGIYYSPLFINQKQTRISGSHVFEVPIGAASVRLFDDLFPRVFQKTLHVSGLSPNELKTKGVDVVISPTLEHFDFLLGLDTDSERYSVIYRMTLFTKEGVPVAAWTVTGDKPSEAFSIWGMIEDDMTDAAVAFLTGFHHEADPALSVIAGNIGKESRPIDPRNVNVTARLGKLPGLNSQQEAVLRDAHVVVVEVNIQNNSERRFAIHASSMQLKLREGQIIDPMNVSSALGTLDKTSQTGGMVGAFTGALFGVLTTYIEDQANQSERELQYKAGRSALFEDRELEKNHEETGVVLFRMPDKITNMEQATLLVWIIDPDSAEGTQLQVKFPTP